MASIVSVTLGVATLIVVNSVMSGFVVEMKDRLHGILSDVEIASPGLGEISWPDLHVKEIRKLVGDDLQAVTCVVRVPALLNFEFRGRQWTQQIMLIGVDEETFGRVTDFNPFLTNQHKQQRISFELEEDGYGARIGKSGWPYRRERAINQKRLEALISSSYRPPPEIATAPDQTDGSPSPTTIRRGGDQHMHFAPLPDTAPDVMNVVREEEQTDFSEDEIPAFDPRAALRPQIAPEDMFDPARDQHTGIIIGLAISARPYMNEGGEKSELFMVRPGDDLQVTLPTAGANPQPITENCTVVDFYSSNMHEYDASFAFMPLSQLQKIRGMIDPVTGATSVSAIQIKLKEGANLDQVRDKLIARFPPSYFAYMIQTWQDTQRPLLSAVNMEVTILNLLLFLIIAVAGFGILATFYMIVVEKTKDIGILKALGAPSRGVMSIFLSYGLSLGTVGTGVGIVLGLLFVYYINGIAAMIQWLTGQQIFDPAIYYFDKIPTIVDPLTVVLVALGAILIAVLASVLPAIRAARLHPVEALRYE